MRGRIGSSFADEKNPLLVCSIQYAVSSTQYSISSFHFHFFHFFISSSRLSRSILYSLFLFLFLLFFIFPSYVEGWRDSSRLQVRALFSPPPPFPPITFALPPPPPPSSPRCSTEARPPDQQWRCTDARSSSIADAVTTLCGYRSRPHGNRPRPDCCCGDDNIPEGTGGFARPAATKCSSSISGVDR